MAEPTNREKTKRKSTQTGAAANAEGEALSFESSIERLEEIVNRLEQGDLSLEETLSEFEAGVQLAKDCAKQLDAAEQRIEVLTREGGELFTRALENTETGDDDASPF